MHSLPVESTTLAAVGYDPALRRLEIRFRSGERYLYLQVPSHIYQQLLQAESKGQGFNRLIRNRFPYQHLSSSSNPVVLAAPTKTK